MVKTILLFLFTAVLGTVQGQVNFQTLSLKEALEKAGKEGKLLFLQVDASACNRCNEVANKSFDNTTLAQQIEETFLPVRISAEHPDRITIKEQFNVKEFGTLFINQNGTLIHAFRKSTTNPKEYQQQIDIALQKAGETLKINELETAYQKGNKSPGFLEALLIKRRSLNLRTEELLEEYIHLLPADSLKSISVLQFIAKMTPLYNSNASNMLRRDRLLFNQAWNQLSLAERVSINNSIILKSLRKAIDNKDESFARQVASFAQSTFYSNPGSGQKAYEKNMLRFYEETGDTANYFKKAMAYYERYLMSVDVDSIKKKDNQTLARVFSKGKTDTVRTGNKMIITSDVRFIPTAQSYMKELNDAARNFYKMTNNSYLLSVATDWVVRAQAFYTAPEAMDTYARLLYKQGSYPKAIELEMEAIALMQKRGLSTKEYELVLAKMKQKVPAID